MIGSMNLFAAKRRQRPYVLSFIVASARGGKWHDVARWRTMLSRFAVCSHRRRGRVGGICFSVQPRYAEGLFRRWVIELSACIY